MTAREEMRISDSLEHDHILPPQSLRSLFPRKINFGEPRATELYFRKPIMREGAARPNHTEKLEAGDRIMFGQESENLLPRFDERGAVIEVKLAKISQSMKRYESLGTCFGVRHIENTNFGLAMHGPARTGPIEDRAHTGFSMTKDEFGEDKVRVKCETKVH